MEISSLSKFFVVRKLTINDVDTIYDMMSKNEIFYQYHPPFVTKESVVEDMEALPPNKSYDDKYYIGFFENDSLVAIMDLMLSDRRNCLHWIIYDKCTISKQRNRLKYHQRYV